jgi:hypothetical protein
VNADDNPPPSDDAVERFAAAVDGGGAQGGPDELDPELARELEIVNRLVAQGAALDPDPEARARARQRLLAALADEPPTAADDGPSRASSA